MDHKQQLNNIIFTQLPTVFILEIIRPNWNLTKTIGTHLNVSHLGFCLKKENAWRFQHASFQDKKIVEVLLADYLSQYRDHDTIKGVNIQTICT
jgi:hypothetical protein